MQQSTHCSTNCRNALSYRFKSTSLKVLLATLVVLPIINSTLIVLEALSHRARLLSKNSKTRTKSERRKVGPLYEVHAGCFTVTYSRLDNLVNDLPVVVILSGLGAGSPIFDETMIKSLAKLTQVVIVDRRGTGLSFLPHPFNWMRKFSTLATELSQVLKSMGLDKRNVILVGYSLGGLLCRLYTGTLGAGHVKGLVLVDPSHEFDSFHFDDISAMCANSEEEAVGGTRLRWEWYQKMTKESLTSQRRCLVTRAYLQTLCIYFSYLYSLRVVPTYILHNFLYIEKDDDGVSWQSECLGFYGVCLCQDTRHRGQTHYEMEKQFMQINSPSSEMRNRHVRSMVYRLQNELFMDLEDGCFDFSLFEIIENRLQNVCNPVKNHPSQLPPVTVLQASGRIKDRRKNKVSFHRFNTEYAFKNDVAKLSSRGRHVIVEGSNHGSIVRAKHYANEIYLAVLEQVQLLKSESK
jgi:pimeloyl-ACP methyl ester carboxylesterase